MSLDPLCEAVVPDRVEATPAVPIECLISSAFSHERIVVEGGVGEQAEVGVAAAENCADFFPTERFPPAAQDGGPGSVKATSGAQNTMGHNERFRLS